MTTSYTDYAVHDHRLPFLNGSSGYGKKMIETSLTRNKTFALENFYSEYIADPGDFDSEPLKIESYNAAKEILQALGDELPEPEVLLEPDGIVAFEWYKEGHKQISLSFYTTGNIGYAGINGTTKFYGNIPPMTDKDLRRILPNFLRKLIREIMNVRSFFFRIN